MAIRVAHVIAGAGLGGAERHVVDLLNALDCEYRALVCIGPPPNGPTFLADLDPRIERFFIRMRWRNLPFSIWRLASKLRERRIDVVHTHMYAASLFAAPAARLGGATVVVTTEHGQNPWKKPVHRWLERHFISPLVDLRFCVSPKILELRRDLDGVPAAKLELIVNGTRLPELPPARAPNEVTAIVAVGRLIPAKDHATLLHAIADLFHRGRTFTLHVLGSGPELDRLRKLITRLGLDKIVCMPGSVSGMESWYPRFDIYASSSLREGLPLALLEAMSWGLPIVATDVGACADAVQDGESGLIIPAGDSAALADALDRLLCDAQLRVRLGRNARARVESHYSISAVANFHLEKYASLLGYTDQDSLP